MTNSEVRTFVDTLDNQGINMFIIRLNAMNEFQSGTSPGIAKAKEVITYANSLNMEVCVDLHTWYTTWDNYFDDSASNYETYRTQYLTYVSNVLSAFSESNVYAFMVLNEPQAQTASSNENNFILNIISTAKSVTDSPVSVRFMGGYTPSTGHYSSAIDTATDFLSRNTYWDPRNPTTSVYGCTEAKLLGAVSAAHNQGKEIWITEFGKVNSDVNEQASYVRAFVQYAKNNGMDRIFCWASQPKGSGETYNIWNGLTPYPAFYELVN
jgi:hypothetical protein